MRQGGARGDRMMRDTTDAEFSGVAILDKLAAEPDAITDRRSRELLEALPSAVYTTDSDGRITFYNEAAAVFWGYRPRLGDDRWCGSWKLFRTDGAPLPHDQCPMAVALRTGRPVRGAEAVAERPDGTRVPFIPFPTPLHDRNGVLIGAVNMLVDITEQKQANARQKLLIDELNHRVKNTLTTVQALAAQTLRQASSPEAFYSDFEARLIALSRAHDAVTSAGWGPVDLEEVLRRELNGYAAASDRVRLSGPPIRLPPSAAVAFAMISHELTTNAIKYGAFSRPEGVLTLTWAVEDAAGEMLTLEWLERGGPLVSPPERNGFGALMIARSAKGELGGSCDLRYEPEGLRFTLRIPLPGPPGV